MARRTPAIELISAIYQSGLERRVVLPVRGRPVLHARRVLEHARRFHEKTRALQTSPQTTSPLGGILDKARQARPAGRTYETIRRSYTREKSDGIGYAPKGKAKLYANPASSVLQPSGSTTGIYGGATAVRPGANLAGSSIPEERSNGFAGRIRGSGRQAASSRFLMMLRSSLSAARAFLARGVRWGCG